MIPIRGVNPYYLDRVFAFADSPGRIDVQADAMALPVPDDELDFLCSSHVLEHLANPLAALLEWRRVLRPGGLLYLVVPDKSFTFDAPRKVSTSAHLVDDFRVNATTADEEHVRDFIYGCDWERLGLPPDPEGMERQREKHFEVYLRKIATGAAVDIHYHTFTPSSLQEVLRGFGLVGGIWPQFRLLANAERYPAERGDGIGMLLEKVGGFRRAKAPATYELQYRDQKRRPLKLVCPTTLAPLVRRDDARSGAVLKPIGSEVFYSFVGSVPGLIPLPGDSVRRAWNNPIRRRLLVAAFQARGLLSRDRN